MQSGEQGRATANSPHEIAQNDIAATENIGVATASAVPSHLGRLAEAATAYARNAKAAETQIAYAKDWKHFSSWCRRRGVDLLPPSPEVLGLYITDCVTPSGKDQRALSVATVERRLSGVVWNYRQRGFSIDRADRHVSSVLDGIRRQHGRPPAQKEAILPDDIIAMVSTLGHDLRGLRDRSILLIGFAGGLRRSEIVGLNAKRIDVGDEGLGWVEVQKEGAILTLRGKTGWREVEIARGSSERTCPVYALERWIEFAKIEQGPIYRPILKDGKTIDVERLSSRHVANLVKSTALAAGVGASLPEVERANRYSGHSLRAGLASSAEIDERYVQKHLGHASAEMTRRYQRRRDRFRVNLTKAAGL